MEHKSFLNINYLRSGVYYDSVSKFNLENSIVNKNNFRRNYHLKSNGLKNLFQDINYVKIIRENRKIS